MLGSGFFDSVAQRDISIRGVPAKSPLFFRDVGMMMGLFLANRDAAARLLPSSHLRPLAPIPGRAVVAITCFEYRDTDIGPYNEVGISVGVQVGRLRLPGALAMLRSALTNRFHGYVADLPVNTEVALHGGLDFFNYPKFLADIRFEERGSARSCVVTDRESRDLIYAFHGSRLVTSRPFAPFKERGTTTFFSYPDWSGEIWKATMLVNEIERGMSFRRGGFRVECGSHPRSQKLAGLSLGHVLAYIYVPRAEAVLFELQPAPR